MYQFLNDYSEGAHPRVLQALAEHNLEQTSGYGTDLICQQAADLIRSLCEAPEADVHFLVGGTQTNLLVIESLLHPYEAVIASETGHLNVHETGAIEAPGHNVSTVPAPDGKLTLPISSSLFCLLLWQKNWNSWGISSQSSLSLTLAIPVPDL